MKIYVGADHRGFKLKKHLIDYLKREGYEVEDKGDSKFDIEDDFPKFAAEVASSVLGSQDKHAKGVLLCGSGQGVCIAANRFRGVRAAICWDEKSARSARNDDDSNVLCLPADDINKERAESIVHAWLTTSFAGAARFVRRINQLDKL